jgi:hypothetical protein
MSGQATSLKVAFLKVAFLKGTGFSPYIRPKEPARL